MRIHPRSGFYSLLYLTGLDFTSQRSSAVEHFDNCHVVTGSLPSPPPTFAAAFFSCSPRWQQDSSACCWGAGPALPPPALGCAPHRTLSWRHIIGSFFFQCTNNPVATLKKDPAIPFSRIVTSFTGSWNTAPLVIASSKSRLLSNKMRENC